MIDVSLHAPNTPPLTLQFFLQNYDLDPFLNHYSEFETQNENIPTQVNSIPNSESTTDVFDSKNDYKKIISLFSLFSVQLVAKNLKMLLKNY